VIAGLDTLTHVQNLWSLDDLVDAHEALDVKSEIEGKMMERARK